MHFQTDNALGALSPRDQMLLAISYTVILSERSRTK